MSRPKTAPSAALLLLLLPPLLLALTWPACSGQSEQRAEPAKPAGKRVNLIFPTIQAVQLERCLNITSYLGCNVTVSTRAADYRLVDFNLASGSSGFIERIGQWKEPDLRHDHQFVGSKRVPKNESQARLRDYANNLFNRTIKSKTVIGDAETLMQVCDASAHLDKYQICIRSTLIAMRELEPSVAYKFGTINYRASNYSAPITAVHPILRSASGSNLVFDLLMFDSTSRMILAHFKTQQDNIVPTGEPASHLELSAVPNPWSTDVHTDWARSQLLDKFPDMKAKLATHLAFKIKAAQVQTITTVYFQVPGPKQVKATAKRQAAGDALELQESAAGSPLSDADADADAAAAAAAAAALEAPQELVARAGTTLKGSEPAAASTTKAPAAGAGDQDPEANLALCLSSGNSMPGQVECMMAGRPVTNVDTIKASHESQFTPLVFHVTNYEQHRHIHLIYYAKLAKDKPPAVYYIYCRRFGVLSANLTLKPEDVIRADGPAAHNDCQRSNLEIVNPPSDMIDFVDDKCRKTISFFGPLYTVSEPGEPIDSSTSRLQYLEELTFQVNAAFSLPGRVYFFAPGSRILVFEASMNADCSQLLLTKGSLRSIRSANFLQRQFFAPALANGMQDPPYLYDYRELEEGARDTNPSLGVPFDADKGPGPGGPAKKAPENADKTKLIIIAVALVVGGLIIASVVYLFCLRERDTPPERPKTRKSRRASATAMLAPGSDLVAKTVRSKYQSATGVSPPPASGLKSHKSQAQPAVGLKASKSPAANRLQLASKSRRSLKSAKSVPGSPSSPKSAKSIKSSASPAAKRPGGSSSPGSSNNSSKLTPRSPLSLQQAAQGAKKTLTSLSKK